MTRDFSLHARTGLISGRPAILVSQSGSPLTAMLAEDETRAAIWVTLARIIWQFWRDDAAAPTSSFVEQSNLADIEIEIDDDMAATIEALLRQVLQEPDVNDLAKAIDEETLRHILIEVVLHEALQVLIHKQGHETDVSTPAGAA